ncbi:MAG: hypothetical protein JRM72_01325 [Nitrososphaerota archaeon]|nr:hypothetical protein [Nitrososphaerota archaeon]
MKKAKTLTHAEIIDEVRTIVKTLKAEGIYCTSIADFPKYVNRHSFTDGVDPAVVEALSDDKDPDWYTIEVRPMRRWAWFVEHTRSDWTDTSVLKGERVEETILPYGYELGSVGGHPPNFDYFKEYTKDIIVTFAFWGNPYHS